MKRKIFISGMYSGPSPSAGLGIARSLKAKYPEFDLVGVDHWAGSSGLHHEVLSDRIVLPVWAEVDKEIYCRFVQSQLDEGSLWITSHDIEVDFLARNLPPHAGLLTPPADGLSLTVKPEVKVKNRLPYRTPEQISLSTVESEIYDFCRRHSWRIWIKGPYHEAAPVTSWRELEMARRAFSRQWGNESLFLQAHVRGFEESICLSAYRGELLALVRMEKRVTTAEGKTWAGRTLDPDEALREQMAKVVADLNWTGGAELELIRDLDGRAWLMEWNPRFPAWIFGAALAGQNLPAELVRAAWSLEKRPAIKSSSAEFTRVVLEIPVDPRHALPLPREPIGLINAGKYGAGLTDLAGQLTKKKKETSFPPPTIDRELGFALNEAFAVDAPTPQRQLLPGVAERGFAELRSRINTSTHPRVKLCPAYSFKTSPDPVYLELARRYGLLAECISQYEVQRALGVGFSVGEIVLNGPGKWWPQSLSCPRGLRAIFCDSVEELERVVEQPELARTIGVRLRLPQLVSRFGIALDNPENFQRVAELLQRLPGHTELGAHFHMASSAIGVTRWFDSFEAVLGWTRALQDAVGRPFSTLDLGGGWLGRDFARVDWQKIAATADRALGKVTELLFEPGKALTQQTMALRTRVLDVRHRDGKVAEIVVDGSIAELPLAAVYPHSTLWRRPGGELVPLATGPGRVLGRICMEDDVLSGNLELPAEIGLGDDLIFLDAGAYERTMAYDFGRGGY